MASLTRGEWIFLALVLIYSFIPAFGGMLRVIELVGGPDIVPANPRALSAPAPIVLHVIGSFVFCIIGAVQFLPSIRRRLPLVHRMLGRIVAVAGLLSAGTGLWMTLVFTFPEALQGSLLYWARIVLSLSMAGLIVYAVVAIRQRDPARHRAAILRAYAIGQGASTQAFMGITWMILFGSELAGPLRDAMMVSAWVINLLIAQVVTGGFRENRWITIQRQA